MQSVRLSQRIMLLSGDGMMTHDPGQLLRALRDGAIVLATCG